MAHHGKILKPIIMDYCKSTYTHLTQVASAAGYNQATVYKHFIKERIPPATIWRYGKAIGYDFSQDIPEYSEVFKTLSEQHEKSNGPSLDSCLQERDALRKKYIDLLEKYTALLEENEVKK